MKINTIILILMIGISFSCRTKSKITTEFKEVINENKKNTIDSSTVNYSKFTQQESSNELIQEKSNETSGNVSIKGSSDSNNPFIFHHLVGKDTLQRISIIGNAEYVIDNYFTKVDKEKTEIKKQESTNIVADSSRIYVLDKFENTISSEQKNKMQEIETKGFQFATWVSFGIIVAILLLIFFIYTYKYFKK